ncbi:MAG TPA: tetratricopeptide repeat protein, partial [Phaeodactylibacter sp.]|nr:tetratricopeptide repeat protein [Phaeodactylibacter sp.]
MAKPSKTGKKSKARKGKQKKASAQFSPTSKNLPSFLYRHKALKWLLLLFGFLLYANTLPFDYTQDDAIVIYDNMYTRQGIKGFEGLLKYDTFKGFFKVEGKDKLVSGGRYRPFTPLMFAIEWQLFKTPKKDEQGNILKDENGNTIYVGSPWIGHLINALLYGLTGLLLYLLLLQVLRPRYGDDFAYFVAFLSAAIFLAHPIHTEAVANIKGRDEIMTLLGSLAAWYYTWRAYTEKKSLYLLAAALLFFIALLSKENAITFLAVIPLALYFFSKAKIGDIIRHTFPLLAVAILFLIIRASVLGWSIGPPSMELMNNPFLKLVDNHWVPFSGAEKMATILFTLGYYIKLLVFPHPLTHDYYPRHIDIMHFGDWQVILSLLLYIGLGIYALYAWRKKDIIAFGVLYFFITISIISNIVFPVGTNMSERFMFMPSVGFSLMMAVLAWRWASKKQFASMKIVLAVLAVYLLLLSAKTI